MYLFSHPPVVGYLDFQLFAIIKLMQGTHLIFELLFTSLFISLSAGVFSGTVLVSSPFSPLSFPWQSHPCHGFQVLLSVPSKFPSPAHSTAGIYVQLPVELNMSTTVLIISLPPNILLSLCSLSQGMVPPTSPESQKPGTALDTYLPLSHNPHKESSPSPIDFIP